MTTGSHRSRQTPETTSSETLPTIHLKPRESDRILAGHPWIFAKAVRRVTNDPQDGSVVQVRDHRRRFVGIGFFNSKSQIRVRLLSFRKSAIDEAWFEARIRGALDRRRRYLPDTDCMRVVNAEGDGVSGLIIDRYEDLLVVQTSSLGMDQRQETIARVAQRMFDSRGVIERNEIATRKSEGLPSRCGALLGDVTDDELRAKRIALNGLQFEIDLLKGHKTGFYLDQQCNYQAAAELIATRPDADILDCFAYQGGFSLHAVKAGAATATGLDQSDEAVATASRNAEINGLADRTRFEAGNVFDWLKNNTKTGPNEKLIPKYDAIILDPPSFTRNRASVEDALRGYKEIHLRALKLLKPAGILITFCCSHHVPGPLFEDVILSAAFDARKILRRVGRFNQSPDHPVIPTIPETEYLKGFAYEQVSL